MIATMLARLCLLFMALIAVTTTQAQDWIRAVTLTPEALFQYGQPFPRNLLINVQGREHRQRLTF